jgi:hypothetical protein
MEKNVQPNGTASAKLSLNDQEIRIERLAAEENEPGRLRLSGWKQDQPLPGPLVLSEKEFIELVHQAIHAGVLSHDFLGKLRERIEI